MKKILAVLILTAGTVVFSCPKPKIHTAVLKAIEWGAVKRNGGQLLVDMELTGEMLREKFGKGNVDRRELNNMTFTYSLVYDEYARNHGMTVESADLSANRKAILAKQKAEKKKKK
ncbi:MAG: hypothetical protein LBQ96_06910 [Fusobacteriaceae bacterium]|nr:hypothetical protein [Fusobacteriaceae bacterium]